MAIVIARRRIDRGWKVVLVGGLAGGMLEFAMSLIQEYLLGSRSWNYANEPLNIGWRTTVPFMLFWGLLRYLIVRFILPLVHLIDDTWHTRLATILLSWILIDAVVTPPAIFLYGQRANGVVFDNWVAQHIGRLSMTTSCACISRTCTCESHRGSSGTIYRPQARSAVMAHGRHARLAPSWRMPSSWAAAALRLSDESSPMDKLSTYTSSTSFTPQYLAKVCRQI